VTCDPITEQMARDMLAKYITASAAVSSGQSYSIDGRSLTRANLKDIQAAIDYWRGQVIRLCTTGSAGPTVRRVIPHG
jgi:hypothetical protein